MRPIITDALGAASLAGLIYVLSWWAYIMAPTAIGIAP